MPELSEAIADLGSAAGMCAHTARASASALSDDALLEAQGQLAAAARLMRIAAATLAAEVGHRSRRELGYEGLAQKRGARTPEALVQVVTGENISAARRLVRVGTVLAELAAHETDPTSPMGEPWLADVLHDVGRGTVSVEVLDVIRAGLGVPNDTVTVDALTEAARTLLAEAHTMSLERLAARSRELRDILDSAGVSAREEALRDKRYLRLVQQLDGMTRITGLLDPESAAMVTGAIDVATSPRRGGPRFVDPAEAAWAARIVEDPRSTDQLALDALVDLVDVGVRSSTKPGARRAAVRVLVAARDLESGDGAGHISGQPASISVATAERHACDGGYLPILFAEDGRALNLGRTQRLHSPRQRIVIAARDGGCLMPSCSRPAAWCEVHHIVEFSRGGETSVDDGVLLCRHHHMLMHNNGWRIDRTNGIYLLIPSRAVDPEQRPIELHSKSPTLERLTA